MWKSEELIFSGDKFHDKVIDLIENSQTSIDLSMYIFGVDEFANEVWLALLNKARRGVKIRVLIDGFGAAQKISQEKTSVDEPIKLKIFHPLPWPFNRFKYSDFLFIWRLAKVVYSANQRYHQKLILIDKEVALLGSRNICNDSLLWRETSVVVSGEDMDSLNSIFEYVWNNSHVFKANEHEKNPHIKTSKMVVHNTTFRTRMSHNVWLRTQIKNAKEQIWITTPYFYPPNYIFELLLKKAKEGLDVRILLPLHSDVKLSKWVAESYYKRMFKAKIRIFEYKAEILHAKCILIDQKACAGSSNFNSRSMLRDLELDVVLLKDSTIELLKKKYLDDCSLSNEVTQLPDTKYKILKYVFIRVFLLIRGWL